MRIRYWSSDVCSSDLGADLLIDEGPGARGESNGRPRGAEVVALQIVDRRRDAGGARPRERRPKAVIVVDADQAVRDRMRPDRSEERRVETKTDRSCRSCGSTSR